MPINYQERTMEELSGAALAVQCLREAKVKHILGIPGAKIDRVFDELYGCPELVGGGIIRGSQEKFFRVE